MAKKTETADEQRLIKVRTEALRMRRKGERVFFLHRADFTDGELFDGLLDLLDCDEGEKSQVRAVKLRAVRVAFIKE